MGCVTVFEGCEWAVSLCLKGLSGLCHCVFKGGE